MASLSAIAAGAGLAFGLMAQGCTPKSVATRTSPETSGIAIKEVRPGVREYHLSSIRIHADALRYLRLSATYRDSAQAAQSLILDASVVGPSSLMATDTALVHLGYGWVPVSPLRILNVEQAEDHILTRIQIPIPPQMARRVLAELPRGIVLLSPGERQMYVPYTHAHTSLIRFSQLSGVAP